MDWPLVILKAVIAGLKALPLEVRQEIAAHADAVVERFEKELLALTDQPWLERLSGTWLQSKIRALAEELEGLIDRLVGQ